MTLHLKNLIRPLLVGVFLLGTTILSAQNAFYINWDSVSQLKKRLEQAAPTKAPGYSLLIGYRDSVLVQVSNGVRDLQTTAPVDSNTAFYIASIGKTFTAAAILKLRQDKKLDLADKLTSYIPGLPSYAADLRLFHLLTHLSGLRDFYEEYKEDSVTNLYNKDVLQFVLQQDSLKFAPGMSYAYSNTAYVLLAFVVEKASGTSFADYVQQNLLAPAGMTHTIPSTPGLVLPNRAVGYKRDSLGQYRESDYRDLYVLGSGGYYSTIGDLHRWMVALKSGKVISPASFDLMTSFPMTLTGKKSYLGMGWNNESWGPKAKGLENLKAYGTFGVLRGFRSLIFYLPDNDLHFILMSNSGSFPVEVVNAIKTILVRKTPEK